MSTRPNLRSGTLKTHATNAPPASGRFLIIGYERRAPSLRGDVPSDQKILPRNRSFVGRCGLTQSVGGMTSAGERVARLACVAHLVSGIYVPQRRSCWGFVTRLGGGGLMT